MKKFLSFALIGLLVAGLFVSCSSDVEDEKISYGLCSVDFDANSKGLQVTVDGNLATSGTDAFFWSYKATKLDSYGKEGEKTSITKFYDDTTKKGLAKLENLSTGKWKFELFAFLDGARSKQVYDGSIEVVLSANVENAIAVPMKRSQVSDQDGTLFIDPAEIDIAIDSGTVVVEGIDGENCVDVLADRRMFGKLSDYSYFVYECNSEWTETGVLTSSTNKETFTTIYDKSATVGTHYIKIKISENGKNDANMYLAMLKVDVYSNCRTTIKNSEGSDYGIKVKRLKEFKIEYYDCSSASDSAPFTGEHHWFKEDATETTEEVYTHWFATHEYGRSELLDEPTKEDFGFAGWYLEPNPAPGAMALKNIEAYYYSDIKLYAKWDTINYKTITWNNNWPEKSTTGHTPLTGGTESGDLTTEYALPTAPACVGYKFIGWYTDSSPRSLVVTSGAFPKPTKHDEVVKYKAKWEPITYTVKFNLNRKNNGSAGSDSDFAAQVNNVQFVATYDEEYEVKDATSEVKGFLGWSTSTNWDTGADKLVCVDGELKNLTATNGETITLYAVWSTMFTPLDYIRSFPKNTTTGPYIDTLLSPEVGMSVEMEMEWAGNAISTSDNYWEVPCGSRYSSGDVFKDFLTFGTQNREAMDLQWNLTKGGGAVRGGSFFEDEKYKIKKTSAAKDCALYVDGEMVLAGTAVSGGDLPSSTVTLFALHDNTAVRFFTDMRLYSCLFVEGSGNVARKFVPCKLATAITDSNKSKFASDNAVHSVGEIGLWDVKTNKFYPNKHTADDQKFYTPDDEWKVTFHANNGDSEHKDRVQGIIKTKDERLHRNIFSKENSTFKGWGEAYNAEMTKYVDREMCKPDSDIDLWALWSNPVSWSLFTRCEYIESTGKEAMNTGVVPTKTAQLKISYMRLIERVNLDSIAGIRFNGLKAANGKLIENRFYMDSVNKGANTTRIMALGDQYNMPTVLNKRIDAVFSGAGFTRSWDGVLKEDIPFVEGRVNVISGGDSRNYQFPDKPLWLFTLCTADVELDADPVNGDWWTYRSVMRAYEVSLTKDGKDVNKLVPCYLNVDLGTNKVVDSSGHEVDGNTKVYGKQNCVKGEAGMWDIVNDVFHPNNNMGDIAKAGVGRGAFLTPSDCFLIYYDANGGLGNMAVQRIDKSVPNVRLQENLFRRPGYSFIGWTTTPDGGSDATWYSDQRMLYANTEICNMTLFAQWERVSANTSKYVELPWLESSDASGIRTVDSSLREKRAFINTNLNGTGTGRVIYQYVKPATRDCNVFGNAVNYSLGVIINDKLAFNGTSRFEPLGEVANTRHTADIQYYNGKFTYRLTPGGNEVVGQNYPAGTPNTTTPYVLFGRYNNSTTAVSDNGGSRLYYVKIYDSQDKLVRDYIPVMLAENLDAAYDSQRTARKKGSLGMWDKKNDIFYANAGPGYFFCDEVTTIIYYANGGDGTMDIQSFIPDGSTRVGLDKNVFTNGTKAFIGWNTKADGTGIWYHDMYETNKWVGGDLLLYAQWENSAGVVDTKFFEVVNYVSNMEGAYVDTKLMPSLNYEISARFARGTNAGTGSGDNALLGAEGSGNNPSLKWYLGVAGIQSIRFGNFSGFYEEIKKGNIYSGIINRTTFKIESFTPVSVGSTSWPNNNINSMYLFGINKWDGSIQANMADTRIYWVTFKENGTLKIDLIPCRLKKKISMYEAGRLSFDLGAHSVGEVGFWDMVSNKFVSNSGANKLLCEFDL